MYPVVPGHHRLLRGAGRVEHQQPAGQPLRGHPPQVTPRSAQQGKQERPTRKRKNATFCKSISDKKIK
jgi:hypothetical protein